MLERLFPGWGGKVFVLVLLGFASTDFVITMTLSAADATAHFIHNPYTPQLLRNQMAVTLFLLAVLGGIFLKGFKEAINLAVWLVAVYLALNAVVSVAGVLQILQHQEVLPAWKQALFTQHSNVLSIFGLSLLLFPRLALGLSGFETGVVVMPLIQSTDIDARIKNTKRLLVTAAIIMSIFLMATSIITTLLIPAPYFQGRGHCQWPGDGLPRSSISRRRFWFRLRPQHDSHSCIRRGLCHGGPSQHHSALSARLRDGA